MTIVDKLNMRNTFVSGIQHIILMQYFHQRNQQIISWLNLS